MFLAVQNSSIRDLVTHWLNWSSGFDKIKVDKTELTKSELTKYVVDKIRSWQNTELTKYRVDKIKFETSSN